MKINFRGPINELGYGRVSLEIAKAIHNLGNKIIYFPIGEPQVDKNNFDYVQGWVNNKSVYTPLSPTLHNWHQFDLMTRIGISTNGAITFFEKNKLDMLDINSINTQDIIFAPSKFIYDIVNNDSRISSRVLYTKMGVDSEFFKPIDIKKNNDTYTFLNVGKLEIRKGHDILCNLFNKAFTIHDNVRLLISWNNPFISEDEQKLAIFNYKSSKLGDKIDFIDRVSRKDLVSIYNSVDCGIFPTRSEGLGMPIMEMMSCGKPVIVTDYSGPQDFCTPENSFLVAIDKLEPALDNKWFTDPNAEWASIGEDQQEQFINYMRQCYNTRYNSNYQGRRDMVSRNWEETATTITNYLS